MNHEHRFQRLRDDALFCECGEIRYVPAFPAPNPAWVPSPYTIPPWRPNQPWPVTTTPPNTTITYAPNTTIVDYPNIGRMVVYGSD